MKHKIETLGIAYGEAEQRRQEQESRSQQEHFDAVNLMKQSQTNNQNN